MTERPSVLLVEDHRPLAESVGAYLEAVGFVVDYAADGLTGLHLAATQTYDAIVLDVGLPGVNGLEICRRLRDDARSNVPIIMLTARDQLDDKLSGFDAGADDYLVKPFAMPELEARLGAIIRRRRTDAFATRYTVGDLVLDTATHSVTRGGRPIRLSRKQFEILHLLMREAPAIVNRESIERALWGDEVPDSDALRSHLYSLRRAIDRGFDQELIETLPGVGFRIRAP
ncbi:MAG TPA: response regulator transcription factor [Pseudomonadales bacterium]|nr:response regulator transcription factor [Pseudomonadales bacterium]